MRVLVVSDDPDESRHIVSALSLLDAEVVDTDDVERMRSLLTGGEEHFDVVVVDGDLRPRGGYAVLYDVRARAELTGIHLPTSVVLGEREQDRWLAAWAGANAVVFKPVDAFELARTVGSVEGDRLPAYGDEQADAAQLAEAVRGHGS